MSHRVMYAVAFSLVTIETHVGCLCMEGITIQEDRPHGQFVDAVNVNAIDCCSHTDNLEVSHCIVSYSIVTAKCKLRNDIVSQVVAAIQDMQVISV